MNLIQLIYVSDLVDKTEAALGQILESAVRHNQEDSITGMLLYADGNFLQVLEGEKDQVHATYVRIRADRRHRNIMLISEHDVPERHFGNWSMGYKQLGPKDVERFPGYACYFQFGFKPTVLNAKPGAALELLELFSRDLM